MTITATNDIKIKFIKITDGIMLIVALEVLALFIPILASVKFFTKKFCNLSNITFRKEPIKSDKLFVLMFIDFDKIWPL